MKVFLLSLTLSFVAAAAGGAYLVWEHHPDRILIERVWDEHYQSFRQTRLDDEPKNYISQYMAKLDTKRKTRMVAFNHSHRHVQKPAVLVAVAAQSSSLVFDGPKANDAQYTRKVAGKGRRKVKSGAKSRKSHAHKKLGKHRARRV